ncbi:hypothetical protein DM860_002474 [Cuscuta australis]|uniref:Leucine-rich repeat-containing N-terminal plant-type domain-containing protein n=1 Tax=Cuscuta australis TaxID=267555 RepID=A0A328CZ60_9ASTE|nr:hypothetical protein DM860_002474 [Cuscuta australis]
MRVGLARMATLLSLQIAVLINCFVLSFTASNKCIDGERHALLKFKDNLLDKNDLLSSWGNQEEEEMDCCNWDGVVCDETTGHVIKLDLSSLYLSTRGMYPSPPPLMELHDLKSLDLSNNLLVGNTISSLIGTNNYSMNLEHLDLSNTTLEGEIPASVFTFPSLKSLNLGSNRLHGRLHPSIGLLSQLESLDVSANSLGGVISEDHFLKLSKLRDLDFSSNNLTFNVTSNWVPPFQLTTISLSSCKLGPGFPNWLRTQVNYSVLDISYAGISDSIPSWFWNRSQPNMFHVLNASNNQLRGRLENISMSNITYMEVDFSFNQLEGPIPASFFNVSALYLSKNKFTELEDICDLKGRACLVFMDISFNQLSGTLRDCWSSFNSLAVLNLAHNYHLSGILPTSIGSLLSLKALHLGNNDFIGGLPSSLKNCSELVAIDVGHNNFSGPIPSWIGENLANLAILVLRSNHFNGSIPSRVCSLQSLQLLDLSMNRVSGSLPKCIGKLTKMSIVGSVNAVISYTIQVPTPAKFSTLYIRREEKIELVWKGTVHEFGRTLGLVKSIDLSSNMLSDEIPSDITTLVGLVSLNLSRNSITGEIPRGIGDMGNLNALDLSNNHLSGVIPSSLALIDGIGVLNVSNNNLSGKVPKGTQLQSFDASAYMGNPGLCGDPLPKHCPGEEQTRLPLPPGFDDEEEDTDKLIGNGFYASMGVGYAVGFLVFFGTTLFNRSCRFAYTQLLDDFASWTCVVATIYKAKVVNALGC